MATSIDFFRNESSNNCKNCPSDGIEVEHSPFLTTPDKFKSMFEPWGDYVFGLIMIVIGKFIFHSSFVVFPTTLFYIIENDPYYLLADSYDSYFYPI